MKPDLTTPRPWEYRPMLDQERGAMIVAPPHAEREKALAAGRPFTQRCICIAEESHYLTAAQCRANLELATRAVNAHDALVEELKAALFFVEQAKVPGPAMSDPWGPPVERIRSIKAALALAEPKKEPEDA